MNPLERLLSHQAHDPAHDGHVSRTGTDHQGDGTPSVLARALRSKVAWIVAALLLLAVLGSGVLVVALVLPAIPTLLARSQEVGTLLAELPRLLSVVLVDAPKALLDALGPLLKLKTALEGAG